MYACNLTITEPCWVMEHNAIALDLCERGLHSSLTSYVYEVHTAPPLSVIVTSNSNLGKFWLTVYPFIFMVKHLDNHIEKQQFEQPSLTYYIK